MNLTRTSIKLLGKVVPDTGFHLWCYLSLVITHIWGGNTHGYMAWPLPLYLMLLVSPLYRVWSCYEWKKVMGQGERNSG